MLARWICIVLMASFLSNCAQDDRTRVVIYSPHGKEMLRLYEDAFEAANPTVDIQWLDMGGQSAYDRIRTERQNPQASIWWGGASTAFDQAAKEGLLASYEPDWSSAVPEDAHHPEHLWYGTFLTPEVIAYNTNQLTEEEAPKDWDDLLEPEWSDRVLIRYPLQSSTMRTIYGAMILRQPDVESGYEWLARLDQNVKTYTADPTQLYLKLARGEGDVTLWNMPDVYLQAKENGYPFAAILPKSGTPVLTDGIALVAGGPNQEAARAFYDFVTADSALIEQAHRFFRIPARQDLDEADLPDWMATLNLDVKPMDWERLALEGPTWMKHWDERIKGRGGDYLAE